MNGHVFMCRQVSRYEQSPRERSVCGLMMRLKWILVQTWAGPLTRAQSSLVELRQNSLSLEPPAVRKRFVSLACLAEGFERSSSSSSACSCFSCCFADLVLTRSITSARSSSCTAVAERFLPLRFAPFFSASERAGEDAGGIGANGGGRPPSRRAWNSRRVGGSRPTSSLRSSLTACGTSACSSQRARSTFIGVIRPSNFFVSALKRSHVIRSRAS
mmetsp:Transcript_12898/g.27810  ORF Transcript_12898/g.27810 Transcript_12898/m.27810 type:complete len:216 (-) Transcript_12898:49-696(-)